MVQNGITVPENDTDYGHADKFYMFLTQELMPHINRAYPNNGRYSVIGHSLSGLFTYYCMLRQDDIFVNHTAISPSLWINYDNIFEIEQVFHANNKSLSTTMYHTCGTQEWMNQVLSSSRRMKETLGNRYPKLNYIYVEHEGEGHNGTVRPSLEYLLREMKF
jgi:predicted alpha/beta superfamily hydrolase